MTITVAYLLTKVLIPIGWTKYPDQQVSKIMIFPLREATTEHSSSCPEATLIKRASSLAAASKDSPPELTWIINLMTDKVYGPAHNFPALSIRALLVTTPLVAHLPTL